MLSTAVNGVLAIGVTFVIITGGIDLSVGTMMTFTAVMAAQTVAVWNLPVIVGVLVALLVGTICGMASGIMVAKFKIPPFIATLGMSMLTKGLSLIIANSKPIYFTNAPSFSQISMGTMFPFLQDFQIPNAVIILFVLAILASFVLNNTIFGRYTFAIGSNEEAVRLSGINTDRWKIAVYAVNGLICGVAGILIASRLNSAQPALGRGRDDPWDDHRRIHHEHADQWAAYPVGAPGVADRDDGHHHHLRGVYGYAPQEKIVQGIPASVRKRNV